MEVICDTCNVFMELAFQAKDDHGLDTFTFHCPKCGGRAAVQDLDASPPPQRPLVPQTQAGAQIEVVRQEPPSLEDVRRSAQPFTQQG